MKYYEIFERRSASMKRKNIMSANSNRTMGFEVEVEVDLSNLPVVQDKVEKFLNQHPIDDFFNQLFNENGHIIKMKLQNQNVIPDGGYVPKKEILKYKEDKNPKKYEKIREVLRKSNNIDSLTREELFELLKEILILVYETEKIAQDKFDNYYEKGLNNDQLKMLIDSHLDYYEFELPEDYIDSERSNAVYDKKTGDFVNLSDITYHNLDRYFNEENAKKLRNIIDKERRNAAYDYAIDTMYRSRGSYSDKILSDKLSSNLGIRPNYVNNDEKQTSSESWSVTVEEGSSEFLHEMGEIISPVFDNVDEGIKRLNEILNLISNDEELQTTHGTGLHINVGVDLNNIDFLKFILFIGEEDILERFERESNPHTMNILREVYNILNDNIEYNSNKSYNDIINEINKILLSDDYNFKRRFLNLNPIIFYGQDFIEIRGMGNKGYENKAGTIIEYTKKISYVLDIAENPNMYKDVYLKKLKKLLNDDYKDEVNIEPVANLTQDETETLVNLLYNSYQGKVVFLLDDLEKASSGFFDYVAFLTQQVIENIGNEKLNSKTLKSFFKLFLQAAENNKKKGGVNRDDIEFMASKVQGNNDLYKLVTQYILPKYPE